MQNGKQCKSGSLVCLFIYWELAYQLTTGVGDFCLPKKEICTFSQYLLTLSQLTPR